MAVELGERQPVLPRIERLRRHKRRQVRDRVRVIGAELAGLAQTRRGEPGVPIDTRRLPGEIGLRPDVRSEEHTSELQSLMRISYAVFCLKKKKKTLNLLQNRSPL